MRDKEKDREKELDRPGARGLPWIKHRERERERERERAQVHTYTSTTSSRRKRFQGVQSFLLTTWGEYHASISVSTSTWQHPLAHAKISTPAQRTDTGVHTHTHTRTHLGPLKLSKRRETGKHGKASISGVTTALNTPKIYIYIEREREGKTTSGRHWRRTHSSLHISSGIAIYSNRWTCPPGSRNTSQFTLE